MYIHENLLYCCALLFLLVIFLAERRLRATRGKPEGRLISILVIVLACIVLFLFASNIATITIEEFCKEKVLPHLPSEFSRYGKAG